MKFDLEKVLQRVYISLAVSALYLLLCLVTLSIFLFDSLAFEVRFLKNSLWGLIPINIFIQLFYKRFINF